MISLNVPSYENISEIPTPYLTTIGVRPFIDFMEEDLEDIIFDTDCFAENVSYIHTTGETAIYKSLVNNAFNSASVGMEITSSSREMIIRLQESKLLREPKNNDTVTVRGIKYNVTDKQPDGVGTVTLHLIRDSKSE